MSSAASLPQRSFTMTIWSHSGPRRKRARQASCGSNAKTTSSRTATWSSSASTSKGPLVGPIKDPAALFAAHDLISNRAEFLVLSRLVLLRAQLRNAVAPRVRIELELLAIDFHLPRLLLQCFDRSEGGGELSVQRFALLRHRFRFRLDLPDFLLAILQNQQLLQLA